MSLKSKLSSNNLKAVMQLIRLPNVLIIILTQVLLRYCIIIPLVYPDNPGAVAPLADFLVLVAVTVLMAIGGYVINDYFDVKIDSINRPDKQVVDKLISPRGTIKLHIILNLAAILLGFYLSFRVKAVSFGLIFPFISGLLWLYSAKYKRMLFWGNFIVSALSAFVILIVWLYEFFWLRLNASSFADSINVVRWVSYVFLGYALFAFLTSAVREIIKDMEDIEGDITYGCKTLPLVIGIKNTRYVVAFIVVATILLLGYAQLILYRLGLMMVFWYFLITVQAGAVYLMANLFVAKDKPDFHFLSNLCKLIMVAGILSMEIIFISI
jgi:4-hydroxybenzoate polyprenyltransferase